eukprot:CAMPEP_0204896554 /NCGR_PEP_ID=MMETSP1397-20131031/229_1 /ASSEMBLY_ACC=CAM_ASM_000891 /TAXON_ID=49980 /ORGANISM="Climacostomum Climacostomum virens, Strain Stock W-24" /LENGTH=464 /DNA_ID=CAMNT_0052064179 /DNA_START=828 /DNA_END=2222 /DNA_ORIENTATION=-
MVIKFFVFAGLAIPGIVAAKSAFLEDTNISETQFGFLSGTAILVLSAAVYMPIGRWADKLVKMKKYVVGCAVLFNLSTLATGLTCNLLTLLLARVVSATTSSFLLSIFTRLIAFYFPPNSRGFVLGVYSITASFGIAASLLLVKSIQAYGWEFTCIVVGASGTLLSLLAGQLFWHEYEFTEEDIEDTENLKDQQFFPDIWNLLKTNRTLTLTTLALAFKNSAFVAITFYDPIYFTDQFPSDESLFIYLAFGAIALLPLFSIIGGCIADCKEEDNPRWRPFICSITNFIAVPMYAVVYTTSSFPLMISLFYLATNFGGTCFSLGYSITLNISPSNMRAFVNGWVVCIASISSALAVTSISLFNSSHEALRIAMLVVVCGGTALSAIFFLISMWTYPEFIYARRDSEISRELLSSDQAALEATFKEAQRNKSSLNTSHELQEEDLVINITSEGSKKSRDCYRLSQR